MNVDVNKQLVFKAKDAPKQILYCVVLEPGTEDLQGDVTSADEIEKAAHHYLLESRVVGDSHLKNGRGNLIEANAGVVESFVAPVDFEVGGERILKGSWVIAIKVNDEELWKAVEDGEITGVSIGGFGERVSIDG
jgi:Putative phage serine protease XkdF